MAKKETTANNLIGSLVAAVLAYLVPGAGHFYLGRKLRGVIVFLVIGATFWTGMIIGGPLTVDPYNDRIWFFAQICAGGNGLYGWQREKATYQPVLDHIAKKYDLTSDEALRRYLWGISETPPSPLDNDRFHITEITSGIEYEFQKKGVALYNNPSVNVARSYSGIAGMLNLLCIMDAVMLALMGVRGEPPLEGPKEKEVKS